jgi:hypothetical protein
MEQRNDDYTGRLTAVRNDGTRCRTGWLAVIHEFPSADGHPIEQAGGLVFDVHEM